MTRPIRIASIEAFSFRVPVQSPIRVAFGTFRDRPFVLVRITDSEGAQGWGEVWANWPAVGAEHRARLAIDIGERLIGQEFTSPAAMFLELTTALEVLVLQTLVRDWATLYPSLLVTLAITGAALLIATVAGVIIAILFVQSRWVERSFFPYAVVLQVTPVVAIAPLIIIWVKDPLALPPMRPRRCRSRRRRRPTSPFPFRLHP